MYQIASAQRNCYDLAGNIYAVVGIQDKTEPSTEEADQPLQWLAERRSESVG